MNITSKSRYALKIMLDLAALSDSELRKRETLATQQAIPIDYMDQILLRLRKKNLVLTYRGPKGGLKLGKSTSNITLWDIFSSVEDHMPPVKCINVPKSCTLERDCTSKNVWTRIYDIIRQDFSKLTLEEVLIK